MGEADVTIAEYFDSMNTMERVDAMSDIVGLLEREDSFCYEDYSGKKPESKEEGEKAVLKLLTDKDEEIERLREALLLADAALSGANMNMKVVQRVVRAALEKENPND
jgi:prophage tail gpP-like protein